MKAMKLMGCLIAVALTGRAEAQNANGVAAGQRNDNSTGAAGGQHNDNPSGSHGTANDKQGVHTGMGKDASGVSGGMTGRSMSAAEVSTIFRTMKHSLADNIKVAEQKTNGGKAFRAECRMGATTAGTAGAANKSNVTCVVWVLTADSKIKEIVLDSETGQVLNQRDAANTGDLGMLDAPSNRMLGGRPDTALATLLMVTALGPADADEGKVGTAVVVERRDFNRPTRWQKASDLIGKKITNPEDEHLGKLDDIVVDGKNGRILYGVVSFGGLMGIHDKLFAIPWQSLQLQGDYKKFVLDVPKDRLKNAEGFDQSHWPTFADEQWATRTHEFYGQKPYWTDGSARTAGTAGEDDYRSRWYRPVSEWAKCSDLIGKNVQNNQDESLGEIKDLAIDPDSGRVIYGILGYSGKRFAVPWTAFNWSADKKHLVLNVTKNELDDSVAFKGDEWPDFTNEDWSVRIYRHYHVNPYWSNERGD